MNPFRYRSYYYDVETGYYYLNSRYYDSSVGRFISADIAIYDDTIGANNYTYCGNNPILFSDSCGDNWYVALGGAFFGALFQMAGNFLSGNELSEGIYGAMVGGVFYAEIMFYSSGTAVIQASAVSAIASSFTNEFYSSIKEQRQLNVQYVIEESFESFAYDQALGIIGKYVPVVGEVDMSPFKNNNNSTLNFSNIGNQLIDSVNNGLVGVLIAGLQTGFSRVQITSNPPIYQKPKIGPGASMYG